jgi:hypothetical protein
VGGSGELLDWEQDEESGAAVAEQTVEGLEPVTQADLDKLNGLTLNERGAGNLIIAHAPTIVRPEPRRSSECLYLDLETVPDQERMELFDLPPLPELAPETSSANCPPPEDFLATKLADIEEALARLNPDESYLELLAVTEKRISSKPRTGLMDAIKRWGGKKREVAGAEADRRKQMAVCPEMCRIVAAGWAVGSAPVESLVYEMQCGKPTISEHDILYRIWDLIAEFSPVVGFNVLGFDLRVIMARSILLGIEATKPMSLSPWGRGQKRDVVDLMVERFGRDKPAKLKTLARLYGIPVPAGDTSGADVERLMAEGRHDLVGEYVRSDVGITRELHRRWRGYFCE